MILISWVIIDVSIFLWFPLAKISLFFPLQLDPSFETSSNNYNFINSNSNVFFSIFQFFFSSQFHNYNFQIFPSLFNFFYYESFIINNSIHYSQILIFKYSSFISYFSITIIISKYPSFSNHNFIYFSFKYQFKYTLS